MEFKKLRAWTKEEDQVINKFFFSQPHKFSSHQESRFIIINKQLNKIGYTDRTNKAISRRSYKLGLRSIIVKHERVILCKCSNCGEILYIRKRYYLRSKTHLCLLCKTIKYAAWYQCERNKIYHKLYNATYKKKSN